MNFIAQALAVIVFFVPGVLGTFRGLAGPGCHPCSDGDGFLAAFCKLCAEAATSGDSWVPVRRGSRPLPTTQMLLTGPRHRPAQSHV